jgi:hypothetical protein
MKLPNIFRLFDPIPTLIILAVALLFLFIGFSEAWKAQAMVKNFATESGTIVGNDYRSSTDPEDSAKIYRSYHPVVRLTTAQGGVFVFTDGEGSNPADYEVGDAEEILYDPNNPLDATIRSWMSVWMGPL